MATAADVEKHLKKVEEAIRRNNADYAIQILTTSILPGYPDSEQAYELFFQAVGKKWQGKKLPKAGFFTTKKLQALQMAKRWDSVVDGCRKAYPEEPANTKLVEMLAEGLINQNNFNAARVTLTTLTSMDKGNATAWFWLAQTHKALENYKAAIDACEKAKSLDSNNKAIVDFYKDISAAESWAKGKDKDTMGSVKGGAQAQVEAAGRKRETKESVNEELKDAGGLEGLSDRKIAIDFAERLTKVQDLPTAIKAWKKVYDIDNLQADALDKAGDLTIQYYDEKLKAAENAGDKGAIEEFRKKTIAYRIQEFRRRVEAYPTDAKLRLFLGESLYQAGKFKDAAVELQKASKDPKFADQVALTLGRCFFEIGQHRLAIMQFDKAIETTSGEGKLDVWYYKAKTLLDMGQKEEAKSMFMEILSEDFQFRDVNDIIEEIDKA